MNPTRATFAAAALTLLMTVPTSAAEPMKCGGSVPFPGYGVNEPLAVLDGEFIEGGLAGLFELGVNLSEEPHNWVVCWDPETLTLVDDSGGVPVAVVMREEFVAAGHPVEDAMELAAAALKDEQARRLEANGRFGG